MREFTSLFLAMAMLGNPHAFGNAFSKRLAYERERQVNPHSHPKFVFSHNDRDYTIYAVNEAAAKEKFEKIMRKKWRKQL